MTLPELSIKRPVFATVMSLVLVLVGLVSYNRLSVREYPAIDPPVVTVQTTYPGASAAIVETQVTQVLEDSLSGIEGIDFITSISRQESSQITVRFKLDRNPDYAAADVRDRVGRVRGRLPDEIEEPIIQKVEADAQPIFHLAFFSDRHSALEITDYAERYVKDQLTTLPGVAEVRLFGEREYSMRIWLDPERLAAYELTPQDIEAALRRQNVEVPSGRIESQQREFTVLAETDLRTPAQFNDLIVKEANGYLVRLEDVGHAELGALDERRVVRFNGKPAIALGVIKQATANPLDVAQEVQQILPSIRESLPEGMEVRVANDKSVFIAESIKNVYHTIGEAIVLVVLIIFLFLRSIRATLIPLVTIPVSLIGAFALMYAFGFTINTLTLLALVLAIGLVVDDAIVVLENIYRHVEEGMPPVKAALLGSREISFAVIAMTITLAAVYAPIGFMTGITGRLFTEFAWTLAGAVIVSGFVALTLSPMMCSKLLRHQATHNLLYRASERVLQGLTSGYRAMLRGALAIRPVVLLIGLGVACASYFLFSQLKGELAPIEDQGNIYVMFRAPEGATIEYTDAYAKQLEQIYLSVPEADRVFVGGRQPHGIARNLGRAAEALGRARADPAGDRQIDRAAHGGRAWRGRLSEQSTLARSKPEGQADQLRDPDLELLCGATEDGGRDARQGARLSRPRRRRHRPQAQLAAARYFGRPGEGGGDGGRDRHARPHARDHARRPAGHALQAERRAIRCRGEDRRHRPAKPRRHAAHLREGPRQRDDPALQPDQHQGDGGAKGAEPFQPASRGDSDRATCARLYVE